MTKYELATRYIELNDGKVQASFNKVKELTGLGYKGCKALVRDITPIAGPRHGGKVTQLYFLDDVAGEILKKGLCNGEN